MEKLTGQKLPDLPVIGGDMVDRLANHANHLAARRAAEKSRAAGRRARSARYLISRGAAWPLRRAWFKKLTRHSV